MVHWRASPKRPATWAPPTTATVRLVPGPGIACDQACDSLSLWSEDQPGWLVLSCLGCISNPFLTSFAQVTSRTHATFPFPALGNSHESKSLRAHYNWQQGKGPHNLKEYSNLIWMHFWDPWVSAGTHAEGFSQILMCKGVAGFQSWTHFGECFFSSTDLHWGEKCKLWEAWSPIVPIRPSK